MHFCARPHLESLNKMEAMQQSWFFQTVYLIITGHGHNQKISSNASFMGGMKPVVFLGRMFCVLSRNDVLKREECRRKVNIPKIISASLAIYYLIYAILLTRANIQRAKSDHTTSEKLGEFTLPSYAWTMFFVYGYQLVGTKRFRNIIIKFMDANDRSPLATPFPSTFPRFCWIMIVVCMLCGITENIMFDVQNVKREKEKVKLESNSSLALYYAQTFYHWHHIVPYHPVITLLYTALVKCGTWGWVYNDIIAITLCRAISEKFRIMNEEVNQLILQSSSLLSTKTKIVEGRIMSLTWDSIREEFVVLTNLVLQIQEFIVPLILACYGANMYISVITIFYWIAPYSNYSFEESSYHFFAIFQFLFRMSVVTYFAANVHHVCHSIAESIHKCPNSIYSLSLERLERTLVCNPVGISLFGSFMITRKFFISIVSFIFTTEIVLLQTANSKQSNAA